MQSLHCRNIHLPLQRVNSSILLQQQRCFALSAQRKWKKYENERYYVPGEDIFGRVWHGLTYDVRRWSRRIDEVIFSQRFLLEILTNLLRLFDSHKSPVNT